MDSSAENTVAISRVAVKPLFDPHAAALSGACEEQVVGAPNQADRQARWPVERFIAGEVSLVRYMSDERWRERKCLAVADCGEPLMRWNPSTCFIRAASRCSG